MISARLLPVLAGLMLLVAGAARANLTTLDVQFSPDAETFAEGESILVTANTDGGISAEYRFVLSRVSQSSGVYLVIGDTGWTTTNTYNPVPALSEVIGGTFRLAVSARATTNPNETITNIQYFLYNEAEVAACNWISGKTFVNREPAAAPVDIDLNVDGDVLDALNNINIPFDEQPGKFTALSFEDGAFEASLVDTGKLSSTSGNADVFVAQPFSGTYGCATGTVTGNGTTNAVTEACTGALGFLGCPDATMSTDGMATIDVEARTVTAGGVTFYLEVDDSVATSGDSAGTAGFLSLLLLCLLGGLRRRL